MTPHRFAITGSIGVRSGIGKDSISVDLDSIVPEDARQVALVGDNGSGKTTLLTLGMNPWREPNGLHGSIYEQFGEQGIRAIEWSHAGVMYRSVIKYRNGKTRAQTATLLAYNDNVSEWHPVTLPDNTVSDGKTRTYDACLEHILGPQYLYYICASRTQGAPKIAEHDDAKGLLRSLLDLDYVDALQERAKGVRREVTRMRDEARSSAGDIDELPGKLKRVEEDIAKIDEAAPARAANVENADHAVAMAKAEYEAVVQNDYARLDLVRRREEAQRLLDEKKEADKKACKDAQNALQKSIENAASALSGKTHALLVIDDDIEQARKEIASHEAVLIQRDAIAQAQTDLATLQAEIGSKDADLEKLDSALMELRKIDAEIAAHEAEKRTELREIETLDAAVKDFRRRAAFVLTVPCGGQGEFASCPALKDACDSDAKITGKLEEIEGHKETVNRIDSCLFAGRDERSDYYWATPEAREALRAAIAGMRNQIAELQSTAEVRHKIESAEQAIAGLQNRIVDLEARRSAEISAWDARIANAEDAIREAQSAAVACDAQGEASVKAAQEVLEAIPEPGSDEAITKAKEALTMANSASQQARNEVATAQAQRAALVSRIDSIHEELHRGQKIAHRVSKLDKEVAHWDLLAKGLQGVVDLSIEAAGPSVAAIANDMLSKTFGGRFALRVVTQKEQSNGRVVETFDISVLDSETDSEASILHKSGGESVWLDASLSLAVALYQQDVSGRRYETRFLDEADDGLAADRKRLYYQMSRAAMDLGGYDREYFVSHHPDAAVWAESVINVVDLA